MLNAQINARLTNADHPIPHARLLTLSVSAGPELMSQTQMLTLKGVLLVEASDSHRKLLCSSDNALSFEFESPFGFGAAAATSTVCGM